MRLKNDRCKRILIITLSNIGDVFLTAPVVHVIRSAFPAAEISLLVGEGAKEVFGGDPRLQEIFPYDKKASLREKWRFLQSLRERQFDLVVDLRNSLFPVLLGVPYHTPLFRQAPREILHKMDRHLWKVGAIGVPVEEWQGRDVLWIRPDSEEKVGKWLGAFGIRKNDPFILLSPGSKSELKRWKASAFTALSDRLRRDEKTPVIFIGEKSDVPFVKNITSLMKEPFHSLVGETSLTDLVALIRAATLLVTNDSASLHIASLVGTPTVAIFGPTDPKKYGPRSERNRVVRKELFCSPCEKARCPYHHECMELLPSEEVYQACSELLKIS